MPSGPVEKTPDDRENLGRLSDRLRAMSDAALVRSRAELGGRSVAAAVHDLCAWAAQRQGIATPVPVLNPLASGDQLWVIGREFLDWAEHTPDAAGETRWRDEIALLRQAV